MDVGILGAGQLGRMLALAGQPLGLRFTFLDPAADACAAPLGTHHCAPYEDEATLVRFCDAIDVATFEFENVPAATAQWVAGQRPLHPGVAALALGQDRLEEKKLFERLGIAVPAWAAVDDESAFRRALSRVGVPAVLKRRRLGYDGKGQAVIRDDADAKAAWLHLGGRPLLLEGFVPFTRELSCIAVRAQDGDTAFYPVTENIHREGILRTSVPRADDPMQGEAQRHAAAVLDALDYVGVLAFEFFEHDGRLLANEIAPRVHNSGHWTIDGAHCSQFENHLRAVCGLPLGSTAMRSACAMVNFIGNHPPAAALAAMPGVKIHLYGKSPRPLRKVGHANIVARDGASVDRSLAELESLLLQE